MITRPWHLLSSSLSLVFCLKAGSKHPVSPTFSIYGSTLRFFHMSHRLWYPLASWYVAFLFLSFLPSALWKLFSQEFLLLRCVQAFAFSFLIQHLKALFSLLSTSYTYSLVMWSFQLIFSIMRHVNISKASNLSLLYFLNVHVSDPYNATLQTIAIITFLFSFLLNLFENSSLILLNIA